MLELLPLAALDPAGGDAAPGAEAAPGAARGGDPARGDALIEVLHRLQEQQGYLSRAALHRVAQQLRLPLSHVYGVASFYHLFRLQPPTPHEIGICLGSACFVRGAMVLAQQLAERLGVSLADPAGDGRWSLMPLGCLGACGQAPVLLVDGVLHTRLPAAAAGRLEQRLQAAGLPPGRAGQRTVPGANAAERPGRAARPGTRPAAASPPPATDPEAGGAGAEAAALARLRSATDPEAGDRASRASRCPAEPRPTPTAAPPTAAPLPPLTTAAPTTAAPPAAPPPPSTPTAAHSPTAQES